MEEIRVVGDFTLVGQIRYEQSGGKVLDGAGIRLYQTVDAEDKNRQFLCVENAETGEEACIALTEFTWSR